MLLLALAACAPPANSRTVTLVADGETRALNTEALTVRNLLVEAGVTLDADDLVTPVEPTFIEDGMTIRVIRVEVRTETEQREIPFERRTVGDASIPADETRLLEPGITGIEELIYRVTLEDGVETDRRLVRQVTIQEPRTEILRFGVQVERKAVPITGTVAYVANHNAWVMQTTSPNQRRLTHDGDLDGRVFALSPDGAYLLFTRVPPSVSPNGGEGASSDEGEVGEDVPPKEGDEGGNEDAPLNTLWMIETAIADAEPLRLEAENVLWASWEPGCQIISPESGCRIAYTTGTPVEGNPGWKAENDMWFARPRPRDGRLLGQRCAVEPSAGGAYGWWGAAYAWSPDGQNLAYARADEVGIIRAYDGAKTLLTRFSPYRTYAPWVWTPTVSWSLEGEFIITMLHGPAPTGEAPENSPVFDIWALAVDGTLAVELVSEAGMWAAPIYAPAGDHVVFGQARSPYASQTSNYDLYLMDRDGSDSQPLFPPAGEIGLEYPEVAWGPGGDQVILIYRGNLYLIHVSDGTVYQLTDEGSVTAVRWEASR